MPPAPQLKMPYAATTYIKNTTLDGNLEGDALDCGPDASPVPVPGSIPSTRLRSPPKSRRWQRLTMLGRCRYSNTEGTAGHAAILQLRSQDIGTMASACVHVNELDDIG